MTSTELRLPAHARHLRRHEVVSPILDLVAPAAQRTQVIPPVVGRVIVDVVPVEPLALAAQLADVRLGIEPVRLTATAARSVRLLERARPVWHSTLRCAHRVAHMLRASGPVDGVPLALRPALEAVCRVPRDRRSAVCASVRPLAILAPRLHSLGSVVALGVGAQWLVLVALAARLGVHATSLHKCRLAEWRTTDPGQRAKAARVEAVEPVPDGQLSLFEESA